MPSKILRQLDTKLLEKIDALQVTHVLALFETSRCKSHSIALRMINSRHQRGDRYRNEVFSSGEIDAQLIFLKRRPYRAEKGRKTVFEDVGRQLDHALF